MHSASRSITKGRWEMNKHYLVFFKVVAVACSCGSGLHKLDMSYLKCFLQQTTTQFHWAALRREKREHSLVFLHTTCKFNMDIIWPVCKSLRQLPRLACMYTLHFFKTCPFSFCYFFYKARYLDCFYNGWCMYRRRTNRESLSHHSF